MKKELSNRRSNSPDPLDSIDMAQRSLDASSLFMETQLLVLGRVDGVADSAQGKGDGEEEVFRCLARRGISA